MSIRKIVKIENLIINPTNARLIIPLDDYDEKIAIEVLCNDRDNHMDRLIDDIARNNLNPNELPIIMPSQAYDGKYEVMDGNRRLTCVKLLLQYRDEIDKFSIPKLVVNAVKNARNIKVSREIECVFSDDEAYINDLLEKLHTYKTGISTVPWKPMAQERHNYKKGELTKINAIVRFLETSKYSNEGIINNINKKGWIKKFHRFINNNKTIRYYFGFEFSKDLDRITMFIHEQEIVKGLAQLLKDSIDKKADGFAQKEQDRNEYLDKFEIQKIVDKSRINDPVLTYYIADGHISATTITPLPSANIKDRDQENKNTGEKELEADEKKTPESDASEIKTGEQRTEEQKKDDTIKDNPLSREDSTRRKTHKNDTTENRPCLIPRHISYRVTDQRSIDLLEELQSTPIKGHRNLIAIGFRSFIEFSVAVFIEKKSKNYNNNGKNLIDKIRHTVSKLESVYGQKELKNIIPKLYQLLSANNTSEFGDIPMFNLFVHHHRFHPHEDELKVLYNNYDQYLKLLWDEINKK